jgi:hypothetical protein
MLEYIEKDSYCFQSLNIKEYSAGLEIKISRAHTRHTHTYLDSLAPSGRVPFAKRSHPAVINGKHLSPFFSLANQQVMSNIYGELNVHRHVTYI